MKELSRIALAIEPSATMAIDSMFKQMKADGVEFAFPSTTVYLEKEG